MNKYCTFIGQSFESAFVRMNPIQDVSSFSKIDGNQRLYYKLKAIAINKFNWLLNKFVNETSDYLRLGRGK